MIEDNELIELIRITRSSKVDELAQKYVAGLNMRLDLSGRAIDTNDLYIAYYRGIFKLLKCNCINHTCGVVVPTTPDMTVPINDCFLIVSTRI